MKDMGFYTGIAKNLKLRFEQHNNGIVESTKERRPFTLIYYEAWLDQNDAIEREKYLKSYHGKMYITKAQILFNRVKGFRVIFKKRVCVVSQYCKTFNI